MRPLSKVRHPFSDRSSANSLSVISYYETLPSKRVVSAVEPGYLHAALPTSAPETPEPFSAIQADIEKHIVPGLTHWQHPNFLAFFPANMTFPGLLGDMYSTAFTCAAFNWLCSPAVTELETVVLDWIREATGLPEGFSSKGSGGGVIQGSASEAVLTAMIAARERYIEFQLKDIADENERQKARDDLMGKLVALGSAHAHSCTQKAAMVLGLRFRGVPVDSNFSMIPSALDTLVAELRAEGLHPFHLTSTLGTTATCAIDPFPELLAFKRANPQIWYHVDAAYAGAALILPENHYLTPPLAEFDSFDFNLHKWLLVPFDASCMFIRERKHLVNALSITPSFLRNKYSEGGLVTDYRDWQIPLGRRFRSLKIWFVIRSYGLEGMRAHIRRTSALGLKFADWVRGRDDLFEIVAEPRFALTVFRVKGKGKVDEDVEKRKALTKRVAEEVNAEGEIYVTWAALREDLTAIRVVGGTPTVKEEDLKRAFDVLVKKAEELRDLEE